MMALLQRVKFASVEVDKAIIGKIDHGLLVFLAVEPNDSESQAASLAERIINYRIFSDANGKMNLNVQDIAGEILIVPQFTLAADTKSGLRPSFSTAATPKLGEKLFNYFVTTLQKKFPRVATGKFGAYMQVTLCNDGPTTFFLTANK